MDFDWTPEQRELRERARAVAAEGVARYGRHSDCWMNGYSREFSKELAAHGFIGFPIQIREVRSFRRVEFHILNHARLP